MTREIDHLRAHLKKTAGLVVDADKTYLVESRLQPIARRHGFGSVQSLLQAFMADPAAGISRDLVEAMTTHETYFFRDRQPFTLFREVMLPHLLAARADKRRIRIWCAACSSGQEPYSLAMILDEEARRLAGWRVDIVATDLSESVLAMAREGAYNQFEVQRGLPVTLLLRHFRREAEGWRLAEHLRSRVQFQQRNLLDDFRDLGTFDVVFCRNVLIYFDLATRSDILGRLHASLSRDGYLMLGAAETPVGLCPDLQAHADHPGVFVPDPRHRTRAPLSLVGGA